jgi:hypothetical protein
MLDEPARFVARHHPGLRYSVIDLESDCNVVIRPSYLHTLSRIDFMAANRVNLSHISICFAGVEKFATHGAAPLMHSIANY